jgi:hypothetical protein
VSCILCLCAAAIGIIIHLCGTDCLGRLSQ